MNFIKRQLVILSDSLGKAEDNLEFFRKNNKFIDLSTEGSRIQSKIETVDNEKTAFELQLQYFRYLEEYVKAKNQSGTIISPSVIGINDVLLMSLINELTGYQKEINKMGMNFSGESPATTLILKQMEEARAALMENVKNNMDNLKDLIAKTENKVTMIESELEKLPSLERKLINIQRKFDLNNAIYTTLLEKNSESAITKASNTSDNRIIDRASVYSSAQIKPTAKKNLIMAIMLGLLMPAGIILVINLLDDKIIDKRDIEKKTKIPVIGYIGHSESASDIPVVRKPGSSLAESFRSVRTSLKYYVKEEQAAVVAVSSTVSGEGKTFFSVNLAAIVGMLGKRVLLIGLDLRKPRMDKVFDLGDEFGMSTYLSGSNSYEQIIQETHIKNLSYVPAGPRPPNPSELIDSPRMHEFLDRARRDYDFILIDTPPVGLVTDGLLLSKEVDVNIFIVRQRYTSRNSLEMMEQLRQQGELKNMAIVMNDISLSGYYGYGMRYNYYHGYGYYYGHTYYGNHYYGGYGYSYGQGKKRKKGSKDYYTED
jgi:capsular exopolysaccharide synthesis family protein